MKKIFFILSFVILSLGCFAQDKAKEEIPESKSDAVAFLTKEGTFLKKDFYDLKNVKGVEFQVLVMTDVNNNKKIACLRLITKHKSSYTSDTYIGTLDSDEIDECINALNHILNVLMPTIPDTYTEVSYKTKDGVEIGAYCDEEKNKWTVFVKTKSYTPRSTEWFGADNLPNLITRLTEAKDMITAKLAN